MNGPTPAELQVLIAGLSGVAEEVGAVLQAIWTEPHLWAHPLPDVAEGLDV